jgi:multiple sugar transport system substrate-binding protein
MPPRKPRRCGGSRASVIEPTVPIYEAYNPAIAEVGSEHVFMTAIFDFLNNGVAAEPAIDKAFKRAEEIFAKYPIQQA